MKEKPKNCRLKAAMIGLCAVAIIFGFTTGSVLAHEADTHPHAEDSEVGDTKYKDPEHGNLGEVGAKLANPLGELWALNFNFETPKIFDGDVNTGNPRFGADVIFQPVLPIPL